MECAACGTASELLYACKHCGKQLCATHHGRRYHRCEHAVSRRRRRRATTGRDEEPAAESPAVNRPEAQVFGSPPQASDDPSGGGSTPDHSPARDLPDETARPGYEPDRRPPNPEEPPNSVVEWLRRQTYVSLSVKVGLIAVLLNLLVFAAIVIYLHSPFA